MRKANPLTTPNEYPTPSWMSPKVEIRESDIHGRGMFMSPLNAGETVVIWGGALVDSEAAKVARSEGKLVMQRSQPLQR